jgi:lambda family phage tail tape measure protein
MDINAAFKITAGVVGQPAVQKLSETVNGLNNHVDKLPGLAKAAGLAMAGLGAGLSVAVLKEKFDGVVESMLKVKDASEKIGSTVEKTGALVQIAKITGDEFGLVEAGVIKMTKALAGQDDTAKGAARALDAIGLSIKDLRQMDPADTFAKVATALDGVEAGTGKTAVAMDIFGKNGAQLLPFLNDYVELSGTVSKVTAEQAEQADQYDRNLRKLEATKQSLYKVISTELLPVASAFVKMLVDTGNETNGVKGAVQGLAADGSLKSFFMEGARAGAALLDVISLIGKGIAQLAQSFKVVFNDLKVAMAGAKLLANPIAAMSQGGMADFNKTLDERNAYLDKAGKDWDERWSSSMTPFTDALEKQFKAMEGGTKKAAETPKRSLAGYTSRAPTDGKGSGGGADPYGNALDSLGQEAAKLQEQIATWQKYGDAVDSAKGAQARYQVESGKFKDLSEKQKIALVMQADAVDALAAKLRDAKVEAEVTKQTEAINANTAALGLNANEQALAAFNQDLANKGVREGTELWNKLTDARRAALNAADDAKSSPMLGLKQGLNELADRAKDTAGQVKGFLTGAFEKGADALTDFVMTGKMKFSDFAKSVLADLAKMIVKQMLFNALKAGMNLLGFGFAKGGAFDASSGVQAFANGGIVNSPTPFKFASGGKINNGLMGEAGPEAIMPLKRGTDGKLGVAVTGGAGGGVQIGSIVVNGDGSGSTAKDTSGQNAAALARDLGNTIDQRILFHRRPGGLLAA